MVLIWTFIILHAATMMLRAKFGRSKFRFLRYLSMVHVIAAT
jgi:hypothetical protein